MKREGEHLTVCIGVVYYKHGKKVINSVTLTLFLPLIMCVVEFMMLTDHTKSIILLQKEGGRASYCLYWGDIL